MCHLLPSVDHSLLLSLFWHKVMVLVQLFIVYAQIIRQWYTPYFGWVIKRITYYQSYSHRNMSLGTCSLSALYFQSNVNAYFKIIRSLQYPDTMHSGIACFINHFSQSFSKLTQLRSISACASSFIRPAIPAFAPIGHSAVWYWPRL